MTKNEPQRKNNPVKLINHKTKYCTGACLVDDFFAWCLTGWSLDAFFEGTGTAAWHWSRAEPWLLNSQYKTKELSENNFLPPVRS